MRDVAFVLSRGHCTLPGACEARDIAYCAWTTGAKSRLPARVVLLERGLDFGRDVVVAVLRHELGHLADPDVAKPGSEKRADRIAALVGGERIRYDTNDLQTLGPGRATRPQHLHQ